MGVAAFPWHFILLFFPLLLLLCWFFWPRMPAGKKFTDPDEEIIVPQIDGEITVPPIPPHTPLDPPKVPPPTEKQRVRKWAKVDTSHYIWARDGGTARPMEVGWGRTGAPESAPVKQGEVVYAKKKSPKPVIVEEETHQSVMSEPEPIAVVETSDPEFEDLEWDRCCCGLCRTDFCFCCKSCFSRSWMTCTYMSGLLGICCRKACYPCWACYHCVDRLRPRWNCCCIENKHKGKGELAVPLLDRISEAPLPGKIN